MYGQGVCRHGSSVAAGYEVINIVANVYDLGWSKVRHRSLKMFAAVADLQEAEYGEA